MKKRKRKDGKSTGDSNAAKSKAKTTEKPPKGSRQESASEASPTSLSREEYAAIATEVARAQMERRKRTLSSVSPEMLAMIAAVAVKGEAEKPATAIAYAVQLYEAACEMLEREARYQAAIDRENQAIAHIPCPKKFPAPLNDFLKLIVNPKTIKNSESRFREYLDDEIKRQCGNGKDALVEADRETAVSDQLAEWRASGVTDVNSWFRLVRQYRYWWAVKDRAKKSASGKAGAIAKKMKNSG